MRLPVRRRRLTGRNALVALQVALSLVLLTMTVFALQIFRGEYAEGSGVPHDAPGEADDRSEPGAATRRASRCNSSSGQSTHARRVPGVRSAAVTSSMPLFAQFETRAIVPEGYRLPDGQTSVRPWASSVDESYFATLGIPLLARACLPADRRSGRTARGDRQRSVRAALLARPRRRRPALLAERRAPGVGRSRRRRADQQVPVSGRTAAGTGVFPVPPGAAQQHGAAGGDDRRFQRGAGAAARHAAAHGCATCPPTTSRPSNRSTTPA